jgi:hypothetical protein
LQSASNALGRKRFFLKKEAKTFAIGATQNGASFAMSPPE